MSAHLTDSVRTLSGIGPAKAAALEKLGIRTLGDLTECFPRDYEDRRTVYPIRHAPEGENVCVCAVVAAPPRTSYIRKGMNLTRLTAFDDSSSITITFFNQTYAASALKMGESYVFYGRVERSNGRTSMTNPAYEAEGKGRVTGRIVPVYRQTKGVTGKQLSAWIDAALQNCGEELQDDLPEELRRKHQLPPRYTCLKTVHAPESYEALAQARTRLVFEELFYLTLGLEMLHSRRRSGAGCRCDAHECGEYTANLPFQLTGAQQRTLMECFADMSSGERMNRLIQGDVGSGKTVVAAGCIWLAAKSGWQSALMAPTEILAAQHYRTLTELLTPLGLRVGLLTGSMKAREKRDVYDMLALGMLDVVIGTHALISDGVTFQKLGLVITDEQHRFGVGQRSALSAKGGDNHPHVLVMSATPIPRTLALMIYGDLDVSVIDERPPGRQKIDTFLVGEDKRERLYGFMRRQVEEGHQVYVVCPAVEEAEENAGELKNATEYAGEMQRIFPQLHIGLVHGRLSNAAKEAAMAAFLNGQTDILVSTTVIEVGVDAPNATLMVIENAERFGLSQLHQLRGRVGRGSAKAYCVLVSDHRNEETRERLKALCATNDGFQIAEKDLELRGPGDFFGFRQHGLPQLHMADLSVDTRVLYEAREAARELIAADPELQQPEHVRVRAQVCRLFDANPDIFN